MHKFKSTALLASLLIAACASVGNPDQPRGIAAYDGDVRLGEEVSKICFPRNIDGFRANTRDTVILEKGTRDEYMLEIHGACTNLKHAQAIQLDSNLSCLSRFDNIVVYDSVFGTRNSPNSVERCSINRIHKWNEKAAEEADELDITMMPVK